MRLQQKTVIALAIVVIGSVLLNYLIFRETVFSGFIELEQDTAVQNVERCRLAIDRELDHLGHLVGDWSVWDDTYEFVLDANERYIKVNLAESVFPITKLNLIYICGNNGNTVWSDGYNLQEEKHVSFDYFSDKQLPADSQCLTTNDDELLTGILSTEHGLMFLCARPILNSAGEGPSRGTFIMGRLITPEVVNALSSQTQLDLNVVDLVNVGTESYKDVLDKLAGEGNVYLEEAGEDSINGYTVFSDLYGKRVLLLKVRIDRTILKKGIRAHNFATGSMLLAGLVILVLAVTMIHLVVVSPVRKLSRQMRNIDTDHHGKPVDLMEDRNDEIGVLSRSIHGLLMRLDESQQKKKMDSLLLLAGGVAHDLNNILGPIVSLPEVIVDDLERLVREGAGDQAQLDSLKEAIDDMHVIDSSGRRASEVIKDLSILSNMSHHIMLDLNPNTIVRELIKSADVIQLKKTYPEVAISMQLQASHNVNGAENLLVRMLLNLLVNACEAMKGQGNVNVTVNDVTVKEPEDGFERIEAGEYVVIKVSNGGSCISKEDVPRLFEPFFTRKLVKRREGNGLGLSIVHRVVKEHGGFIDVSSSTADGTAFSIYLPAGTSVKKGTEPVSVEKPAKGSEHILVVDDESAQRLLARRILSKMNYTVTEAESGSEALELLKASVETGVVAYDLVLLDMIMDEGFDGLRAFREMLKINPDLKVVVCSGHAPEKMGIGMLELGADWLSKPYSGDDLARMVRNKLDAD